LPNLPDKSFDLPDFLPPGGEISMRSYCLNIDDLSAVLVKLAILGVTLILILPCSLRKE